MSHHDGVAGRSTGSTGGDGRMDANGWDTWVQITTIGVNLSLLLAAGVAVVKLRLFNLMSRRYRSEVSCRHHRLPSGRVVFEGNYVLHNTGERPMVVRSVDVRLVGARTADGVLRPDEDRLLARRRFGSDEASMKGLFTIEAGERTIFPLQVELDDLEAVVFLLGGFTWPYRRDPAPYVKLYVPGDDRPA